MVKLKIPFADLLPPLSTEEFDALKKDIEANGVRDKIIRSEDGEILDGHHRYKIKKSAPTHTIKGSGKWSDEQKQAYVIATGFKRRNLSPDQKRELTTKQKKLCKALREQDAKQWTQQRLASMSGVSRQAVAKWFDGNNATGCNASKPDARVKLNQDAKDDVAVRVDAGESQEQVAADFGVTTRTVRTAVKAKKDKKKKAKARKAATRALPKDKFNLIYADPPWRYEHSKTDSRKIENQYPTLSLEEICKLGIPAIAAKDAILFLWATSPKLAEAMQVIDSWGFEYKTCMVWIKNKIGMGYHVRQKHELLLIATKGSPGVPDEKNRPSSVIQAARGKHSEKPDKVYSLIEKMYPDVKRVELFARRTRRGWDSWGNEVT